MKSNLSIFFFVISAFVYCLRNLSSSKSHEDIFLDSLPEILFYLLHLELWSLWQWCFCDSWWEGPYHKKANSRLYREVDIKWGREETHVKIGLWILKAAISSNTCNFHLLDVNIPKSIIIN